MRSIFGAIAVTVGVLSSCSTISYVSIETYNPSEITFPQSVGKVLMVNNALPQPSDVGYEYKLMGVMQDTSRIHADSALFDACKSLGKAMADVAYFNDVLLYHEATRKDAAYYSDQKLTQQQVRSLCNETGAEAVVSFDRLLFEMKKDVSAFAGGYLIGMIDVRIVGIVRTYLPQREQPLATVLVADSLFWSESADNQPMLDYLLPQPDDALRAAAQYVGSKVYANFVPHWQNESRWYFTGVGAFWKEASAFAAAGKWERAADRWKSIYSLSKAWKTQAKTASNLALSYEMRGNLTTAHEWATKSHTLFKENDKTNSRETQLLQLYVEALAERIRSDNKLNMQFGKE